MNEIVDLLTRHGAALVFTIAFLEQIGAPVPAIPVLIVAGAVAASSGDSLLTLLALAVAGALLADTIWFLLGRRFGYSILAVVCRVSFSPDSCVRQTESFFERWGLPALLFAKFIPGFSIVAPPMAGMNPRSSWGRFLAWDAAGAVIWAGLALGIGVVFQAAIGRILETLESLGGWSVVLIISLVALVILFKWWKRRRLFGQLRMARIDVAELHAKIAEGARPVIFDVRSSVARTAEPRAVPGARLLDPDELDAALPDVSPNDEIVLYCT